MNENQWFLADFVQICMYIVNLLSKQDLKHFSKIDILGFAAIVLEKAYTSDKRKQLKHYYKLFLIWDRLGILNINFLCLSEV